MSDFPGVNAHLNSRLLQPDGGWEMFHAEHIIAIRQRLDAILPDNYYAASEKSLQVTTFDDRPAGRTTPDVSVYRTAPGTSPASGEAAAPTAVLPIDDATLDDQTDPHAVTIYRMESGQFPGTLVTRLELLSPANKPGGSHYPRYLQRRHETLHSRVNLIEIDYLHTTHPIVRSIPSYPRREDRATPYYVLVSQPSPSVAEGQMRLYAVGIDQPLPRLSIPLAGGDAVVFDLNHTYHQTIDNARVLRLLADTAQPLVNPQHFSDADRERIRALLA